FDKTNKLQGKYSSRTRSLRVNDVIVVLEKNETSNSLFRRVVWYLHLLCLLLRTRSPTASFLQSTPVRPFLALILNGLI
ncbi:hypothetical protein L9F63_000499, partial [Diploptera punctata]